MRQVYDAACKHHEPAAVPHAAERLYRRLSRLRMNERDAANLRRLETDAAARESIVRARVAEMREQVRLLTLTAEQHEQQSLHHQRQNVQYQRQNAICQQENARYQYHDIQHRRQIAEHERELRRDREQNARHQEENLQLGRQNRHLEQENLEYRHAETERREKLARLEGRLALITGSRTWKLRERLVAAVRHLPGLGHWRRERAPQSAAEKLTPVWSPVARAALPREPGQEAAGCLPRATVIIVNYNGLDHLPACLQSLAATDYPRFDVTLVDNGSSDGSVDWVPQALSPGEDDLQSAQSRFRPGQSIGHFRERRAGNSAAEQ